MLKNLPHHWIALIHLHTYIFLCEFIRSTSIQLVLLNIRFLPTLTSHTLKFSRLQIRWDWSRVICSSAYICTTPGTPRSSTRWFVKRGPWAWRWLPSSRGRRWWSSLKKNKRSTSPGEDSNLDLQLRFCILFLCLITCTSHVLLHTLSSCMEIEAIEGLQFLLLAGLHYHAHFFDILPVLFWCCKCPNYYFRILWTSKD